MAEKHGTHEENAIRGELTYALLTGTRDFSNKAELDAWGVMRAPFSPQIARLSAELTADGYELDIKPWMAAGWGDCIFILEDHIVVLNRDGDSRLAAIEGEWKLHRAKSMIRGINPISDLVRAVRQLFVTDLGKTIVMTHSMQDGRAVVAVSFIGTTQKYYDWFSNFKFHQETGMHYGFLELARKFEEQATRILLPKLAAELGEETFSLADVIQEIKKPDSRITLWLSGHSQGGALVQTYAYLMMAQGVPAANIQGYTYAAPTVAAADGSIDPKRYPIYNIVNTDDLVPRIGAQVRLGVDYFYRANNAFRERHYRIDKEQWDAVERAMHIEMQVQSTEDMICWGVALMRMMRDMDELRREEMDAFFEQLIPQLSALNKVNLSRHHIADLLEKTLVRQLENLTGGGINEEICAQYVESMESLLSEFGAKDAAYALVKSMTGPHRMRGDRHDEAFVPPYIAIARRHLAGCEAGVWLPDAPARCMSLKGETLWPTRYAGRASLPEAEIPRLEDGGAGQNS